MNLRFIDDMLDEYKDLVASIGCFKNKWHDSVVAIEGSLHLTPEAFAALVKEKILPVETDGHDGNIHMGAYFDDLRITCVILQKPICPAKEDSCPT